MKRLVLSLFLLAAAAGGGWYYYGQMNGPAVKAAGPAPAAESRGVPVVTKAAAAKPMPVIVTAIGTVQPLASVIVKTRVDGQILKLHVGEGQEVRQGDLLYSLDTSIPEAQLHQAEGALAKDKAQLARSQADLKRFTELSRSGYEPQQKYEQALADTGSYTAAIKSDEAAIESIKLSIGYAQIRAPIDGRLGVIAVKAGQFIRVADNVALATLTQMRPINVAFSVPERELPSIRAGFAAGKVTVSASAPADGGGRVDGVLTFIDSQVDVPSGTILLKATFDNADERLWPGQFVDLKMTTRVDTAAIVVPTESVQTGQSGTFVYVVKADSTAQVRPVKVARTIEGDTVIAEGLAAGDRVVIDGALRVTNGSKVAEQSEAKPAPPSAPPKQGA